MPGGVGGKAREGLPIPIEVAHIAKVVTEIHGVRHYNEKIPMVNVSRTVYGQDDYCTIDIDFILLKVNLLKSVEKYYRIIASKIIKLAM